MKLQNVKIRNFKGIEELEFNPEKLNVLVAKNGKGKTSTIEAIRYLLTGEYPDKAYKTGKKEFSVEAEIAGENVLRGRKIKNNITSGLEEETAIFKLNGKTTTAKSFNELMLSRGVNLDKLKTVSSKEIMEMDVDVLTKFLLEVVPISISIDKLVSLDSSITLDMEEEICEVLPTENITLDNISDADKYFTQQRKHFKQLCEQKKAQTVYNGPDLSKEDCIDKINKQYEENISKIAAAKEQQKNAARIKDMINTRNQILNSIKEKQELSEALKCEKPVSKQLEELKDKLKKARTTISENKGIIMTLKNNITTNSNILKNLDSDICPLSCKLICKTDKKPLKNELSQNIEDNKTQIANIETTISKWGTYEKQVEANIDKFNELNNQYIRYIDTLKDIENLKKNLPKEVKEESIDIYDTNALELENRILKEKLDNFKRYTEYMDNLSFLKILESKRDLYIDLCKLFDEKNGLREKILSFALEPFEEYVNKRAIEINLDMKIKIETNKGVRILYTPKNSNEYVSYVNASSGEKLVISFLILDMINALSGMGILFLDNLDKCDEANLLRILKLVSNDEVQKSYDNIFIAMVDHTDAIDILNNIKCNKITL